MKERWLLALAAFWTVVLLPPPASLSADPLAPKKTKTPDWVQPMKKVHAQFKGTGGTFAHFGDSITVTMAFWAPLRSEPKGMGADMAAAHRLVNGYMKPECWDKWKGSQFGNTGSMTIRWAHDHVDQWLKKHNPEVVLLMFGTNDIDQVPLAEYERKTRQVVERCLKNGTIVIANTIPPRSGTLDKSRKFAAAQRKVASELQVPLVDYFAEILKRRPDDWDGSLSKFKDVAGDEYQVPTLVSRDGVHPSNPQGFRDYSEKSLRTNGYVLRNYLV